MRTTFIETLCDLAETDQRIWLMTGDLGFSVLEPFRDRFPDHYLNVGVAEQNLASVAAGVASCGNIVFIYSIANFPTIRCLEQIRNDVCYHELPVKIVAVGGGFAYGAQGYTHHGLEDVATMRALPGMTVVSPGDPHETRAATHAIASSKGPCYMRLGKAGELAVHAGPPAFELGRALQVRDGADVTLISTGTALAGTVEVAKRLAREDGIEARVVSMHTVKPLDQAAVLGAARETGGIVTVEEHSVVGGLGSAVAEALAESNVPCGFFRRFGAPDHLLGAVGSREYLWSLCGDLKATVMALVRDAVHPTRFDSAKAPERG